MTKRIDRIRSAILTLSRSEQRTLASAAGISRDDLTDFAETEGVELKHSAMVALESWFLRFDLRQALGNSTNGPRLAEMAEATGIPDYQRDSFKAGNDGALTVEQQHAAVKHLMNVPDYKPETIIFGSVNPPLAGNLGLRAQALAILNRMGPEQLSAFIASHGAAKAA